MAPGLIGDACALLNLPAKGREADILDSLAGPHHVTAIAVRETHKLRGAEPGEYDVVTLTPLVETRRLVVVTPTSREVERFVGLAEDLDDGEALALAVAGYRRMCLVTDDRKAIATVRKHGPDIACRTTPEWVHEWARSAAPCADAIAHAVRRIETRACYCPRPTDPLAKWWQRARSGGA